MPANGTTVNPHPQRKRKKGLDARCSSNLNIILKKFESREKLGE